MFNISFILYYNIGLFGPLSQAFFLKKWSFFGPNFFANGSNTSNWKWTAVKAVEVSEEDKEKYPIPGKPGEFYKKRMDMENGKSFEERDYMEALSYIGVLPK